MVVLQPVQTLSLPLVCWVCAILSVLVENDDAENSS